MSQVISPLLGFCIATLCDWLKNLAPLSQPIRNKNKTNCDLAARVLPRLAPIAIAIAIGAYFLRVLIGSLNCVCCDWTGKLLWFCHERKRRDGQNFGAIHVVPE